MIAVPPDVWGVGWECVSVLPCLKEGLVAQYFESEKGHELATNFDMDSLVKRVEESSQMRRLKS